MDQYLGKFVVSPLDGNTYCRKNGQFLEHIRSHGYDYQSLFEAFNPDQIQHCACGKKCVFNIRKMRYNQTCGTKECANRITRSKRLSRTPKQWEDWKQKHNQAMMRKTNEELELLYTTRSNTGHSKGSYIKSVVKREQTCLERYNDPKYNNSTQISQTKQDWDQSRVQLFKDRLTASLNGKTLNDFHTEEMFAARRRMLESRGDIIPLTQLSEWQQYSKRTRNLTEQTYRKHKNLINPLHYPRSAKDYELDHIVPIFYGFQNGIPEYLIASLENLQMLPVARNRTKGKKYDPTVSTKHQELENTN